MSYENIPEELKQHRNWMVWRYELTDKGTQTKVPYNLMTGAKADKSDSRNHFSYMEAVNALSLGYSGIGFALTHAAGYAGIDMDKCHLMSPDEWARCETIIREFDSYTEYSPSGNGLHVIIKAQFPSSRLRNGIELYTQPAYLTFTGNVYGQLKLIADRQELAMQLYNEMGNGADSSNQYIGDAAPKHWDEDVIAMARSASNGQLFSALFAGDWSACGYPSQSEADQALMNIIVFYTKNRAQAARIFKMSGLGQREKAQRHKYIEYTLDRAFDQTLPPLDFTVLVNNMTATIEANKKPQPVQQQQSNASHELKVDTGLWRRVDPPGLLSQVIQYFMDQSPRPVRDISLVASLGLFAGIAGRCFNVSNTGLNVYLMLLAQTGSGKEAMRTGINSLMHAVAYQSVPAALDFLGPSDMASGAGLLKHLADRPMPSFVSLTGEVGLRMQQLSSSNANQADITLRKVLLDLYPASKKGGMIRPTVYSDKKNNVELIHSPNFTWLGESTSEEFYKALSEQHIASGLLPRFSIVEFVGNRPKKNENHANAAPSFTLIENMRTLCEMSLRLNQEGRVIDVAFTNDASTLQRQYDYYCDDRMNNAEGEWMRMLWNRADLKAMKIAALLAISENIHQPTITYDMMRWGISFVHSEVMQMVSKFEDGDIGQSPFMEGCVKLATQMVAHIEKRRKPSHNSEYAFYDAGCVSRSLMMQMTAPYKVFKEDKRLFGDILSELEKQGVISKLSKMDAATKFNSRAEIYQVCDTQWFYGNQDA